MEGKVCNNCRFWTIYIDNGHCDVHDKHCEIEDICDKYEPSLSKAWENFIISIGEVLKLDKYLEWLNNKLNK